MGDRIYGPIRGAGTQVREAAAEKSIVPGQLGSTVFAGVFERGNEDDITLCPSNKSRRRKMGGLLDSADFNATTFSSLEAPLNAKWFYDHSDGSGYEVNLRIVPKNVDVSNDDTPDKAVLDVFNREESPKLLGQMIAHNGGRWAGQREYYLGTIPSDAGLAFPNPNQIQLENITAKDFKRDEYKNGTLDIHGITATYNIVSNSSDGLFTLAADQTLDDDWAAAGPPSDLNVTIYRDNLNARGEEKRMSVVFKDGTLDSLAYFGVQILVDGDTLLDYENLSMDDSSPYYWVDVINNDPINDLVTVSDTFTGNRLASSSRPANRYGLSKVLTSTVLTLADPFISTVSSTSGDWVPTITVDAFGSSVVPQLITITVLDAIAGTLQIETSLGNRTYSGAGVELDTAITTDDYMIDLTLGSGAGTVNDNDIVYIYVRTLYEDELIGGRVVPDTSGTGVYTIVSNTANTVTVSASTDLTDGGSLSGGEEYRLEWGERFGAGYDGYIAGMTTNDYEPLFDIGTSPLIKLKSMNFGLVKVSVPGIAKPSDALALQKKVRAFCLSQNWMYRVEIPDGYVTEETALNWVNTSYGRLDLTVAFYPTFMNIRDPLSNAGSAAREVTVSTVGMQLGREAKIANQYDGYHKAGAGITVTLPLITSSDVLGRPDNPIRINEELLNPAGVNVYRWATGGSDIIAWGDRTLDNTTKFKFKHKREQLSHYQNVLLENFDWAIFEINDPIADAAVLATLHEYFLAEFRKRAIRGDSFVGGTDPAAIIKMDKENNTTATRAQGNQNVDIQLRLADVVERLIISLNAMGVSEG